MVLFRDFVFFTLWTFAGHFSTASVWSSGKAQPGVIGSPQPIVVTLGDDVILPCHLDPPANVEGKTVEWSKPDLEPDPSAGHGEVEYVHVYRNRREDTDMKIPSYVSRTMLFPGELKHGNISLKITNVTLADGGRYRCYIPKLEGRVKESVVKLVVAETTETLPDPRNLPTPEPKDEAKDANHRNRVAAIAAAVTLLVLIGAVIGYLLRRKSGKANDAEGQCQPRKPLQVPAERKVFSTLHADHQSKSGF